MHFDERETGDFKIYTGALEIQPTGYRAAVIISRVRGVAMPREVYRDESLAGGHAWPNARDALQYAMALGQRLVRERHAAVA